jgi:hypothetical protein
MRLSSAALAAGRVRRRRPVLGDQQPLAAERLEALDRPQRERNANDDSFSDGRWTVRYRPDDTELVIVGRPRFDSTHATPRERRNRCSNATAR